MNKCNNGGRRLKIDSIPVAELNMNKIEIIKTM